MLDEPCRELVALTERFCDGLIDMKRFATAKRAVSRAARREWGKTGRSGLAEIGPGLLEMLRLEHLPGWEGPEPRKTWFVGTQDQRREYDREMGGLGKYQTALLHDLFGNPFSLTSAKSRWRTPQVIAMAAAARDVMLADGQLDRGRLGTLADALEEAGCADDNVLNHCRSKGPHVRGCWVLDMLLASNDRLDKARFERRMLR
jgi:hypothetical protein